ncbi:hypothetical protein N9E20_00970 [Crocinitomicaceae bacterium]|nr:hypothetical protein [Crocinitomicaceae bacterium]
MKITNLIKVSTLALTVLAGTTSCEKEVDSETMATTPVTTTTELMSKTIDYEFNNGQVIASAAYDGKHSDTFSAQLKIDEVSDGVSKITVMLMNTVSGETYHVHAHDAADPSTTPNSTPYNETPNTDVLVQNGTATGTTLTLEQTVNMSYIDLTSNYEGFFVVHDPLQAMSTTDISTYLIVNSFGKDQTATNYQTAEFDYAFNTGQVASVYAYNGSHATDLSGKLRIQELANGESRVTVNLMNTLSNEMYHVHSHDAADPSTTPNGTPYNETPNSDVLTFMITGNGGTANNTQMSTMSLSDLTNTYEGFFVVHDPLQTISTTDPTTYVLLGSMAR